MGTAGELLAALRRASAGHTPPRRCIAVLSTAHPSAGGCARGGGESSEAVTEQIAHALADLPDIDVAAGSMMPILHRKLHLGHIARQLGADEILFTNVCETTHSMQLTGMLLGAVTGTSLWSGRFSGRKGECESVLSELAPQLARAVGSALIRASEHASDAWVERAMMPASA